MTAFYIALSSAFELFAIALLIYGYIHENKVIAWENRVISKTKRFIRRQLRKSKRIIAWAEKPAKHEIPDDEFTVVQIKASGDVWR